MSLQPHALMLPCDKCSFQIWGVNNTHRDNLLQMHPKLQLQELAKIDYFFKKVSQKMVFRKLHNSEKKISEHFCLAFPGKQQFETDIDFTQFLKLFNQLFIAEYHLYFCLYLFIYF